MKMINTLLLLFCSFAIGSAYGQSSAEGDVLVYEKTEKTPAFFGSGWGTPSLQELTIRKDAGGQSRYVSNTDLQIFDSSNFVLTVVLPADSAFKLKVTSDKTTEGAAPGTSWRSIYTSPPRLGSKCPTDISFDYVTTPISEGKASVKLYGEEVEVRTVTLKQEGTWSSPLTPACGQGRLMATIVYSPEMNVVVDFEMIAFVGSSSLGDRKTLKEIRRAR